MNRAPKKAESSLKSKIGFNNNNQNSNNNTNTNNVGQNNTNNDKEGEQENENIIECMNVLNEQEEAEQFAISLLEEIIWNAETLLFEKYIEKQIIPFTLNFFENKIMEIIDWNFFKYDNGLINEDAWNPDKELVPIINDSWARGAIPNKQSTIQIQNMNKDGWNIDNIYNYTGQLISTTKASPDKSFEQSIKAQIIEPINMKQKQKDKRLYSKNIPEKKVSDEETIRLSSLHNNNLNNDIEKLQNDIDVLNNFIKQKNALSSEAKKTLKKNITSSKMKKNGKLDKLDPLLNYNKNDMSYNYEKYVEDISLEIPSFVC
ncbi:hypothetical protein PIROE2DRAFT_57223 [Piromyces sp. E2]|nr:hypothetical protein PIROE2DRAFT_57223 [Piromyces sp. E2]|eukprot:OUM69661.1 hypothetical protein PIROE2DRAFT_57223 [Piromyces sp. E2]